MIKRIVSCGFLRDFADEGTIKYKITVSSDKKVVALTLQALKENEDAVLECHLIYTHPSLKTIYDYPRIPFRPVEEPEVWAELVVNDILGSISKVKDVKEGDWEEYVTGVEEKPKVSVPVEFLRKLFEGEYD